MSVAATETARPWMVVRPLVEDLDLGPGLDPGLAQAALQRLVASGGLQAVVVFGSRARGAAKFASDLDLVVQGQADAAYLAQSRWHVMGDVAREGRVLYVAG